MLVSPQLGSLVVEGLLGLCGGSTTLSFLLRSLGSSLLVKGVVGVKVCGNALQHATIHVAVVEPVVVAV